MPFNSSQTLHRSTGREDRPSWLLRRSLCPSVPKTASPASDRSSELVGRVWLLEARGVRCPFLYGERPGGHGELVGAKRPETSTRFFSLYCFLFYFLILYYFILFFLLYLLYFILFFLLYFILLYCFLYLFYIAELGNVQYRFSKVNVS